MIVPMIGFSQITEDQYYHPAGPAIGLNSALSNSNIFFGADISFRTKYASYNTDKPFNISYGRTSVNYSTLVDEENPYDGFENGDTLLHSALMMETQVLRLGWATNIDKEDKIHDFSLSLLEASSPLHISFLQFGTYYVDKNLMWYYKPEIGIGLYGFEIFYSYNLFFKKQDAEDFDGQNMLNFRFSKQF